MFKKYISVADVAAMLGYSSEMSFRNSSAYKRHIKFLDAYTELVENSVKDKIISLLNS